MNLRLRLIPALPPYFSKPRRMPVFATCPLSSIEKNDQEQGPLLHVDNGFRKIIVRATAIVVLTMRGHPAESDDFLPGK